MIDLAQSQKQLSTWQFVLPDLTSMLDILFILLVFFMLTIGSVYQSLDLKLPSSAMEEIPQENLSKKIMLEIGNDRYALDGKLIKEFEQFKKAVIEVIQKKPQHELVIAGDKNISIERLLNVLTYLQSQCIEAANILMQDEGIK